jgi:hypothetical protein
VILEVVLGCQPPEVAGLNDSLVLVLDLLTDRVHAVLEDLAQSNSRGLRLEDGSSLLLLGWSRMSTRSPTRQALTYASSFSSSSLHLSGQPSHARVLTSSGTVCTFHLLLIVIVPFLDFHLVRLLLLVLKLEVFQSFDCNGRHGGCVWISERVYT